MTDAVKQNQTPQENMGELPMMLEMTFILSRLIVAAVSVFVVVVSIWIGVDYLTALFRGIISVLVLGFLFVLFSYFITRNSIAALKKRMQQVSEQNQAFD